MWSSALCGVANLNGQATIGLRDANPSPFALSEVEVRVIWRGVCRPSFDFAQDERGESNGQIYRGERRTSRPVRPSTSIHDTDPPRMNFNR